MEQAYLDNANWRAWLKARDEFLDSATVGSFNTAIRFSKTVPEALWLKTLFGGRPPLNNSHLVAVLERALLLGDTCALAYYACIVRGVVPPGADTRVPTDPLRAAAEAGHPVAQREYAMRVHPPDERLYWFSLAAQQDDPYSLEYCALQNPASVVLLARGAIMGSVWCMSKYASAAFRREQVGYWLWKARAALHCNKTDRYKYFAHRVQNALDEVEEPRVLYAAGAACCTPEGQQVCNSHHSTEDGLIYHHLSTVIRFYKDINRAARAATFTWMATARRLNLYKDVARMIGQLVWTSRSDADYATVYVPPHVK